MTSQTNCRKIAIIGAGPGGLTLAALLKRKGIPTTIFERDADRGARSQGGSLDLHSDGGQLALSEAGLIEEFKKFARYGGEDFKMTTKDLQMLIDETADEVGKGGRPEIDRVTLRDILLDAVGVQNITWNKHVAAVEPSADVSNKFNVRFQDGTLDTGFDLVVGADGAWSKVRSLLTDIEPYYSGVSAVSLTHFPVSATNADHVNLANLVRRGSAFAFGDGKGIQAQRLGDNSIKVYCSFKVADESWIKKFDKPDFMASVRQGLLAEFKDWHRSWKDAIELCDYDKDTFMARPLYMLPVGITYENRKGVTLIGDSAHLCTPYAGEGVNIAMLDALELSNAITSTIKENDDDFYNAVQQFELKMFERAKKSAWITENNMEKLHSQDFPKSAKELIEIMTGNAPPPRN